MMVVVLVQVGAVVTLLFGGPVAFLGVLITIGSLRKPRSPLRIANRVMAIATIVAGSPRDIDAILEGLMHEAYAIGQQDWPDTR